MKKILCSFLFMIIGISLFLISGCEKNQESNNLKKITLGEVTHSAFYAPLYVAKELNFFEDEGLDVEIILVSGANNVVSAVLSGDVNIGFCGPEATIYVYNGNEKDYIQSFAGLTKRDGQFIVSREKIDNFNWNMLKGKEVLAGRIGGMPELNFENALKNTNIDKEEVIINTSVDFASLTSAFLSGTGNFVNLFEPNATKLEKMGLGHIVASIGEKSGEMPYTAFNSKKSYIKDNKDTLVSFTKAISKGLEYVESNDATTIANAIINQFPDTSLTDLASIIKRYKDADSWLDNPYITEESFKNLEDIIMDSGEITDYVPYEDLVNNIIKE